MMKKQFLLTLIFLIPLFIKAQELPIRTFTTVPQPAVTILNTEPEQPIEGKLVTIYFRFYNPTDNPLTGWIGAEMYSGTGAPGKSVVDWPIKDLGNKQSVDGAIMVRATDAGIQKKLRVFFYETQQKNNTSIIKGAPKHVIAEKDINIAALINFRLNTFTINHTRARTTDSDFGSLYAAVDGQPVMQPASIYMGEFKDGTYPFGGIDANKTKLSILETGPIALVPGLNSNVHIAYTIYNGGGVVEHYNFLKGYAEATANPALFHGPRPGTNTAFEIFKKLVLPFSAIGACDGLVVLVVPELL